MSFNYSKYSLNPIWAKDPDKNITSLRRVNMSLSDGVNIAKGVTSSDCRMPCTETITTAKKVFILASFLFF